CYAITVHKSQGSEFDYCVIPLSGIPGRLCTRNILYTAVTRAKRMVVLIGDRRYIRYMVDNNSEEQRYTCLAERLRSGAGAADGGA
ncbi:MAG: ATP-binding domain-containing protein, partial [Clostridia bacterium]|nr:ATP-binding domain-containing protein [Clostridia bacterium]